VPTIGACTVLGVWCPRRARAISRRSMCRDQRTTDVLFVTLFVTTD